MKLIVVGDIHNHWVDLENIVDKFPNHKILQIGDIFDDFGDHGFIAKETAQSLKRLLQRDNYIQLFGNHDLPYYPKFKRLDCSGFSFEKYDAINSVLTDDDWNKFKFYHYEYGWYFSHAGLTKHWFADPLTGDLNEDTIKKSLEKSIVQYNTGLLPESIYAADYYRGGRYPEGGLLWCDWRALKFVSNLKQVVGHTPLDDKIIIKEDIVLGAININVDCQLKEVLEIDENGVSSVIKI